MMGAIGRVFDLPIDDVLAGLEHLNFGGANESTALQAYEQVRTTKLPGEVLSAEPCTESGPVASIFDNNVGGMPKIRTGSWATRKPQRRRLTPPCNHGCPAGNDVRAFVEAVGKNNYDQALEILLETSPLPGVCGRVCPAPCMEACNRGEHEDSVNIREI